MIGLNLLSLYEESVPHIPHELPFCNNLMGFITRVSWLKGQALLVTDVPALANVAHLTLDQALGDEGIWKTVKHIKEIVVSPSILSKRFSEWTRSDVNPSIVLKPHSEWTAGDVAEAYMVNNHVLTAIGMIKSHPPSVSEYRSAHHGLAPPIDVF